MADYRLAELAARSGVSERNIRAYRERGLLDPPRRQGRAAYFADHHLAQLETITGLLGRGFSTAHIAEFIEGIRDGKDPGEILGLNDAIFGSPRSPLIVYGWCSSPRSPSAASVSGMTT